MFDILYDVVFGVRPPKEIEQSLVGLCHAHMPTVRCVMKFIKNLPSEVQGIRDSEFAFLIPEVTRLC